MRPYSKPIRFFLKSVDFCLYRNNENIRNRSRRDPRTPSIVLYDHACPLCRAEMQRLKKRDREERLLLIDIASPDFNEQAWGIRRSAASAALHVLTPEKQWLIGMPAIRHVYAAVGLGWLMKPSGWPVVSTFADLAYRWFAPNRFVISRWLGMSQDSPGGNDETCTDTTCSDLEVHHD